jgi:uncharacterized protein
MFTRNQEQALQEWFVSLPRKPLVLRGARQVGKSTLVRNFAKKQGLTLIEVNLEKYPLLADVFVSKNIPQIIKELEYCAKVSSENDEKTLLFIDEIQSIPSAIEALRYFYEERKELAVIAAGSLLEFAMTEEAFSMPVGRVEYFYLGPVTFREFLVALEEKDLYNLVTNFSFSDKPFSVMAHQRLKSIFFEYVLAGGLPEASYVYVSTRKLSASSKVLSSIADTYREDFGKYCQRDKLALLQKIYSKLPLSIGEKLVWSKLDAEVKALLVRESVDLLAKAQVISLVPHTNATGLPLRALVNEKYVKPYFVDCGLALHLAGVTHISASQMLDANFIFRGPVAEQFVAQHLLQAEIYYQRPELYFWLREGKTTNAQIDFVIQHNTEIIPIEVKAGESGSMKSLQMFMASTKLPRAVRFDLNPPSRKNVTHTLTSSKETVNYELISLPLYLVGELRRLLL